MKERISGGLDKETTGLKQHTIYIDRYGMWYDSGDIVRAQRAERGKSQTSQTSERDDLYKYNYSCLRMPVTPESHGYYKDTTVPRTRNHASIHRTSRRSLRSTRSSLTCSLTISSTAAADWHGWKSQQGVPRVG